MITEVNRVDAHLHSPFGVFDRLHPFQPDRQGRVFPEPGNIAPVQFGVDEASDRPANSSALLVARDLPS